MIRHLIALLAALCSSPVGAAGSGTLRIAVIDVEGGAATLYITPRGRSLLIDTGWPAHMGGGGNSVDRIIAAARSQGLSRIDYLIVTHYHVDHVGGAADLIRRFPVGTVIDHGPNRELPAPGARHDPGAPATLYPAYLQAVAGHPHRVMLAGEKLEIDGLELTAITSDGAAIKYPLAGAGEAGSGCDRLTGNPNIGGEENPRSLGLLLRWGQSRMLSLADLTWDAEAKLVCPRDRIGRVDLMLADNHGSDNSNNPALIETVRPRIAIIANGSQKGGSPVTWETLSKVGAEIWQLHFSIRSQFANTRPERIANPGKLDGGIPLLIHLDRRGGIAVARATLG